MAKVLIVGCGAIGSELAGVLSAQGHDVTGLKRKPPTSAPGPINYVTADISSPADLANLDSDFTQAFFIVSPDGRNEQSYRAVYETGLNNLLDKLPDAHWLMVSSTSVYGQSVASVPSATAPCVALPPASMQLYRLRHFCPPWMEEMPRTAGSSLGRHPWQSQGEWVGEDSVAEPDNITSCLIRQAEQKLMALNPKNIVVRFSGIYGPGREYLLRQAMQTPAIQQTPPYFTNRIHQRDCVGVLAFLLEQRLAGKALAQCYLASDDDPAPMWDVMAWLAERLHHCPPPTVKAVGGTDAGMNKRCSNARLKALGYQFQYPSYKDGYLELIDARDG